MSNPGSNEFADHSLEPVGQEELREFLDTTSKLVRQIGHPTPSQPGERSAYLTAREDGVEVKLTIVTYDHTQQVSGDVPPETVMQVSVDNLISSDHTLAEEYDFSQDAATGVVTVIKETETFDHNELNRDFEHLIGSDQEQKEATERKWAEDVETKEEAREFAASVGLDQVTGQDLLRLNTLILSGKTDYVKSSPNQSPSTN